MHLVFDRSIDFGGRHKASLTYFACFAAAVLESLARTEQKQRRSANRAAELHILGVCSSYILEQGVLDHAGCRYVLSGCIFAGIFATFRHHKPTAGMSAGISKSARLVAINAVMCCIYCRLNTP